MKVYWGITGNWHCITLFLRASLCDTDCCSSWRKQKTNLPGNEIRQVLSREWYVVLVLWIPEFELWIDINLYHDWRVSQLLKYFLRFHFYNKTRQSNSLNKTDINIKADLSSMTMEHHSIPGVLASRVTSKFACNLLDWRLSSYDKQPNSTTNESAMWFFLLWSTWLIHDNWSWNTAFSPEQLCTKKCEHEHETSPDSEVLRSFILNNLLVHDRS